MSLEGRSMRPLTLVIAALCGGVLPQMAIGQQIKVIEAPQGVAVLAETTWRVNNERDCVPIGVGALSLDRAHNPKYGEVKIPLPPQDLMIPNGLHCSGTTVKANQAFYTAAPRTEPTQVDTF